MKRFFYLAFAALAVFACTPEEQPSKPSGEEGNGNGQQEQIGGYDSISVLLKNSNIKTAWAAGDELQVYCVTAEGADVEAKYVLSEGAGTATGKFAPAAGATALPKGGRDYFAAYPYDEDRTFAQHNTFTVVIPAKQTGAMPLFAAGTDADGLELNSFMGAVKFVLNGEVEIKNIALEDKNSNSMLSGNVTYNAKTGKVSIKNSSATKHEINYVLPEKLVLNGKSDPFIIEVPAGTLADGGKLTLFDMNDNAAAVLEFPAQTIAAGAVAELGELSFEAVSQTVDLSVAGTANCYIIPGTGTYKFKAVVGNSKEEVAAATAEVFWETCCDTVAIEKGAVIKSAKLENGYVVVETAKPAVPGNALIAAKNADGEILWSWHLWLPATTVATVPDPDGVFYSKEVMDRNLGALVPVDTLGTADIASYGMCYQWGRKDPLTDYAVSANEFTFYDGQYKIAYTIAHPNEINSVESTVGDWTDEARTDLWDNAGEKTIYDPCPVGYRVPVYDNAYGMWQTTSSGTYDANWVRNAEKGWAYFKATGIAFPVCGYLSGDYRTKENIRFLIWSATAGLGDEEPVRGSGLFIDVTRDNGWVYYKSYFRYAAGSIRCVPEH